MNSVKIHSKIRAKYQGLFGFERGMSTHHAALMAAMRHFERIGDDASLGLVLMALVRGRKPWLMDLRYKYFKMDRLERFSEVLLVLFRWVTRNGAMSVDEVRRLLKKLELHVQDQGKRTLVSDFLFRLLDEKGRLGDAYDAMSLAGRHDRMGLMRKRQVEEAIGRVAGDMYRPIDQAALTRTMHGGRSLLADAERHLRQAVTDVPDDTTSRMHLVELLVANGDDAGALDASRGPSSDDFDAQAQRLVLLLREHHRELKQTTADRKKSKAKKRKKTVSAASVVVDEVIGCCGTMLSLDPSATECLRPLFKLHDLGLLVSKDGGGAEGEGRERERERERDRCEALAAVLSGVHFDADDARDEALRSKASALMAEVGQHQQRLQRHHHQSDNKQ